MLHKLKVLNHHLLLGSAIVFALSFMAPAAAFAGTVCGGGVDTNGDKYPVVNTSIDIGCTGQGNPILDMLFAIVRFLSAGVGLVVIGSIVYGGIQYTASRGDPQSTAKAIGRIQASVIALIIFIFGYAILNYLVPGGLIHP